MALRPKLDRKQFIDAVAQDSDSSGEEEEYSDYDNEDDSIVTSDDDELAPSVVSYLKENNDRKSRMKEEKKKVTSFVEEYKKKEYIEETSINIVVSEKSLRVPFNQYRLHLEPNKGTHILYQVRVEPGKEDKICRQLFRRMFSDDEDSMDLTYPTIFSVFTPRLGFGFIFVESITLADVITFIQDVPGVKTNRPVMVPYENMVPLISPPPKIFSLTPGGFVTVRRNPNNNERYKGDIAQVIDVDMNGNKAVIKLIPRIDYDELRKWNPEDGNRVQSRLNSFKGSAYIPPQGDFNVGRIKNEIEGIVTNSSMKINGRKVLFNNWDERLFSGPFVYIPVPFKYIIHQEMIETSEITSKFKDGVADFEKQIPNFEREMIRSLGLASSALLKQGDIARIRETEEYGGMVVKILSINGTSAFVEPKDGENSDIQFHVELDSLQKYFTQRDYVEITNGPNKGRKGEIVSVNYQEGFASVMIFSVFEPVKVEITFLAHTSSLSTNVNVLGPFRLEDFVRLTDNSNGVIWRIEQGRAFVLLESGASRPVGLSEIQSKAHDSYTKDSKRNNLSIGNKVKVSEKAISATVIHMNKEYIFVKSPHILEYGGISVFSPSEVSLIKSQGDTNQTILVQPLKPRQDHSIQGKTIKIMSGPNKGCLADIKEAYETEIKATLHSTGQMIRVSKENQIFKDTDIKKNQSGVIWMFSKQANLGSIFGSSKPAPPASRAPAFSFSNPSYN